MINSESNSKRAGVRARRPLHRTGRLHRDGRGGDGTARPLGGVYRGGVAGLVAGAGSARAAGVARHDAGGGSDIGRRTWRHHLLRQSTPIDGLSWPGAVGALQWRHAMPVRHYKGWERHRTANADRGRLELPVSGQDQPRPAAASGSVVQGNPRHRVEAQSGCADSYRTLAQVGKPPTVVTAAIARELSGFVWVTAKQATPMRAWTG